MPLPIFHLADLIHGLVEIFKLAFENDPLDALRELPALKYGTESLSLEDAYKKCSAQNITLEEYIRQELNKTESPYKTEIFNIIMYFIVCKEINDKNAEILMNIQKMKDLNDYFDKVVNYNDTQIVSLKLMEDENSKQIRIRLESYKIQFDALISQGTKLRTQLVDASINLHNAETDFLTILKTRTNEIRATYDPAHRETLAALNNENQEFAVRLEPYRARLAQVEREYSELVKSNPNSMEARQKKEELERIREQVNGADTFLNRRSDLVSQRIEDMDRTKKTSEMTVELLREKTGAELTFLTPASKGIRDNVMAHLQGVIGDREAKRVNQETDRDLNDKPFLKEMLDKAPMKVVLPPADPVKVQTIIDKLEPRINDLKSKIKILGQEKSRLEKEVEKVDQAVATLAVKFENDFPDAPKLPKELYPQEPEQKPAARAKNIIEQINGVKKKPPSDDTPPSPGFSHT